MEGLAAGTHHRGSLLTDYSCATCPHDTNDHSLVATHNNDPLYGGVILCPVPGCECYATWSVPPEMGGHGREGLEIPDRFRLAQLREYIQS